MVPGMGARQVRAVLGSVVKRVAAPVDDQERDDLTQELWYQATKQRLEFADLDELSKWATVVVRRIAYRWRKRARVHIEPGAQVPDRPAPDDPLLEIIAEEMVATIRSEVDGLPEDERRVIAAIYYDGLTYAETAQRLALTVEEVSNVLRRAKRRLGVRLDAHGFRPGLLGVALLSASGVTRLLRRLFATPPIAGVVALSLAVNLGLPTLPVKEWPTGHRRQTSAARHGKDDVLVPGGGPQTAGPASPRAPITGQAPTRTPGAGRGLRPRLTVRVKTPAGDLCAGTDAPPSCRGDRLSFQTPEDIARYTDATKPLDGTGVQHEEVPLCAVPNTPATRCEPDSHRPSR